MKTKNWAPWLVIATMVMMVVRYSAAFAASDMGQITGVGSDFVTFLTGLTGIGMGILDTAGGGFLFNGWSRVFPKNGSAWSMRFKILSVCVFGLLFSGMFILVPFTMSRLAHESVLDTLGGKHSVFAWMWSAMVNLIPYVIIGGVFTGNKMVEQMDTSESTSGSFGSRPVNSSTSGSTSGTSKMGRPSIHQEAVFSYMNKVLSEDGRVASFTEVQNALSLPESTASRLRASWIEQSQERVGRS